MSELTKRELDRYSRQIILPKIGMKGQKKLKDSHVIIVGLGGLGTVAATYLTCAGIGHIRLVDRDIVEMNNLQRQILYDEGDVKKLVPKAIAAGERLQKMNSDVVVEAVPKEFNSKSSKGLLKDADLVLDCNDNLGTRYLLNEECVRQGKPFVHGAALGDFGMVTTIIPEKTPCYECIFPKNTDQKILPTCEGAGILGQVAGMIGVIQASEAMNFLAESGELLTSKLVYVYTSPLKMDTVHIEKNPYCRTCSENKS